MNTIETPEQVDLQEQSAADDIRVGLRRKEDTGGERFKPEIPASLEQAGVPPSVIEELILKNLYFRGEISGRDLSKILTTVRLISGGRPATGCRKVG